jgi:phosphoribosyl 1,2-cyclic phosphodiesterase
MKFTAYASSSSGNLYTLSDGQTDIIIECGVSYKDMQKLLPKSPTSYDACVYSHRHGDHYKPETAETLKKRGIELYGDWVAPVVSFPIGTMTVKAWLVKHDVDNWMYMFLGSDNETCVFILDTYYSPVVPSFSPTIVAIECNWMHEKLKPEDDVINDRLYRSHMNLEQCINTLKAWNLSKTRDIHLLHISDSRGDVFAMEEAVQAATGVPTFAAPKKLAI